MLKKITWSDRYKIGIPEIDRQHQSFFVVINKLIKYGSDDDIEYMRNTVSELRHLLVQHTKYEERLLESEGYPDLDYHKREHEIEIREFIKVIDEILSYKSDAKSKLVDMLSHWFEHHLLVDDMAYQQFLIRKGVIPVNIED